MVVIHCLDFFSEYLKVQTGWILYLLVHNPPGFFSNKRVCFFFFMYAITRDAGRAFLRARPASRDSYHENVFSFAWMNLVAELLLVSAPKFAIPSCAHAGPEKKFFEDSTRCTTAVSKGCQEPKMSAQAKIQLFYPKSQN